MTIPRHWWPLLGGGAFALLMPAVLLLPAGRGAAGPEGQALPPLGAEAPPVLQAVYERPLFAAPAEQVDAALPEDAPQLVGIVGRLGEDAVALVRGGDGATRTLRVGESVDGWQLASLAIDAAFFTRGAQRARVPLPAG
ncbi:hypothetical protein LQ953_13840 [Sphingomonas sp. IC-56]|uniref:hypothetical protein n=1 Tax=Sphingomonas sp. IC-56 TaxID=2898529 RepID=UPI001E30F9B4|nr:hypothetical protein [Sphingomonas sp. IC-56]MCD2325099.1 hypothetical protein [Sphingomonas sp. IC-56]